LKKNQNIEPNIILIVFIEVFNNTNKEQTLVWICNIISNAKIEGKERKKIEEWLKVRVNSNELIINFREEQVSKKQ
jgi:hypothetical protein